MTDQLRIGIIGAGMIAHVVARAIKKSDRLRLTAVTSRRIESAQLFAKEESVGRVFENWEAMIASSEIDAVYIATPTHVKEEISVKATEHHKHILVDKPYESLASLERIINSAKSNQVCFMDATHFSHHERTGQLKNHQVEIGKYQSLRSTFFIKSHDKLNIRFDPNKEPMGAVGDMGWYCMRAITEYLAPTTDIEKMSGHILRDKETNAAIRGTGFVVFKEGCSSSLDFGYDVGACLMDLDIFADSGMLRLDDFVLDWAAGFAEPNTNIKTGYQKIIGLQLPHESEFITVDSKKPQVESMLDHFAGLIMDKNPDYQETCNRLSLDTQSLLDSFWYITTNT